MKLLFFCLLKGTTARRYGPKPEISPGRKISTAKHFIIDKSLYFILSLLQISPTMAFFVYNEGFFEKSVSIFCCCHWKKKKIKQYAYPVSSPSSSDSFGDENEKEIRHWIKLYFVLKQWKIISSISISSEVTWPMLGRYSCHYNGKAHVNHATSNRIQSAGMWQKMENFAAMKL